MGANASTFIQANTNGRLHDATEPSLTPLNRGFLYGDAVYEVWRSYEGVLFAWSEHWQRLVASASALGLDLPLTEDEVWREVQRTVAAWRERSGERGDVYVRLQVYRGEGAIGLDPALAVAPGFILMVQPVPRLSDRAWNEGLRLHVVTGLRRNAVDTLPPAWKTGNYLNNLMGLREARAAGADDALFLNQAGCLTEASTSNVALIAGDRWITPPLSAGILAGITRALILHAVAARAGLQAEERDLRPEDWACCDEAMLTSTTKDVQPIGLIDAQAFAVGPGTATRRLKSAFADYVRTYVAAHPERTLP